MSVYDVCIIGAGASGLVAGIETGKRGLSTIIIDKNKKSGKKLYATGNGRCNIANAVLRADSYFFNEAVSSVISEDTAEMLRNYFLELGVPFTERNGYFYPASNQASTVVWALKDAAKSYGAEIIEGTEALDIKTENYKSDESGDERNVYEILTDNGVIRANAIILAMGSPAAKSSGGTDEMILYKIYDSLGLKYEKYRPVLSPLKADVPQELNGVRTPVRIKEYDEYGELQLLTGILSGIVIFNVSYYVKEETFITLDLIPDFSIENIVESIKAAENALFRRSDTAILNGYVNDKLATYFSKKISPYISPDERFHNLISIFKMLKDYKVNVSPMNDYERSQSAAGGILPDMINLSTMLIRDNESETSGIAVCGETVNITGKCGGYNLMWAFASGIKAGKGILK